MKLVAFVIADKEYALGIEQVLQVIRIREITPVPQAPDFVQGVIIWHARAIPLISLRKKFSLEKSLQENLSRIIIVKINRHNIGIVVDKVTDVLNLESGNIEPPDEILKQASYLTGVAKVGQRLILLMDIEKLLSDQEKNGIEEVHAMVEVKKKEA